MIVFKRISNLIRNHPDSRRGGRPTKMPRTPTFQATTSERMQHATTLMIEIMEKDMLIPISSSTACGVESSLAAIAPTVFSGWSKKRRSWRSKDLIMSERTLVLKVWQMTLLVADANTSRSKTDTYICNYVHGPAQSVVAQEAAQGKNKEHQSKKVSFCGRVIDSNYIHKLA